MLRFLCSLCFLLFKCVCCSSTQCLSLNRRSQRKQRGSPSHYAFSLFSLFTPVQVRLLLVDSVLVFKQEIAEEAERKPKSCCVFSTPSVSSCSNEFAARRLSACFYIGDSRGNREEEAISRVLAVKLGFAEAVHGHFPAEAGEVPKTVVENTPDDVKIGRNHP